MVEKQLTQEEVRNHWAYKYLGEAWKRNCSKAVASDGKLGFTVFYSDGTASQVVNIF